MGAGLVVWTLPISRPTGPAGRGPEVPATATDLGLQRASNSPAMVSDPTDNRFLALANRTDGPDFGCALQVSGDGGQTWVGADPVPALPPGSEKCYAPEVAFDGHGTLYYLFVGLAGLGNSPVGVFLTTTRDRGRTFSPSRQVLGPLNFSVRMGIDTTRGSLGRILLVWLHAGASPSLGGLPPTANPILSAYSDDGGRRFSEPVTVSDPARQRVVAPALALGPGHRVVIAYYDLGRDAVDYQGLEGPVWDGTWSLVVSTSSDGGQRFGPSEVVDDGIVASARVLLIFTMPPAALVVGHQRDCLAWTDARYGDDDVLLRCSSDGGRRWKPVVRVNDDPRGNGSSQYLPRLGVAPNGRVDVAFYDRRHDLRNEKTSVAFSYSYDGQHFSPNVALNREGFKATIGETYGVVSAKDQVDFGSRLGVLSEGSSALVAWTDTRNAWIGQIGQDVYTARAQLLLEAQRPVWARPVGIVLFIAGVGSLLWLTRRRLVA